MEAWKVVLIVVVSGGLVDRVMRVWHGFPPPRHWRLRGKVLWWVGFGAATALVSMLIYIVWSIRDAAGA